MNPGFLFLTLTLLGGCSVYSDIPENDAGRSDIDVDASVDLPTLDTQKEPDQALTEDMNTDRDVSVPDDWWDVTFPHRVSMTTASTLTDQPVRVVFRGDAFDLNQLTSNSLRFLQDEVVLPIDVERDDDVVLSVWVRVPDLSQPVVVYWGNDNAFSSEDAETLWSDYNAVFHMANNRDVSGALGAPNLEQNVTFEPGNSGYDAVMADGFLSYDGGPMTDVTVQTPSLLMEAFVQFDAAVDHHVLWNEGDCIGWTLRSLTNVWRTSMAIATTGCGTQDYISVEGGTSRVDEWQYTASHIDLEADTITLYVDGVRIGQMPLNYDGISLTTRSPQVSFGTNWQRIEGMAGRFDEVRFSRKEPTPGYLSTQLASFRDALVSFGDVESL